MRFIRISNKSFLAQAVLASSLFGTLPINTWAALTPIGANGDTSTNPDLGTGYNFVAPNITFTILDGYNIGHTAGTSVDNDFNNLSSACGFGTCVNDTLIFAGNSTVPGSIGPSHPLGTINLTGGAGKNVNFQGNVITGPGNLNFAAGSTSTTTTKFSNFVTITGNIDNTSGSADKGTLVFLGISTVTGSIGATHSVNAINLQGSGISDTFNGNINVGSGNFNFAAGSSASTTAVFADAAVLTGSINNTTAGGGIGIVQFLGGGKITGDIGSSNSLNMIILNGGNGVNKTFELNGGVINAGSITLNDDGSGNSANGSTLILNKSSMVVTANIAVKTNNEDTLNITNAATINGTIGSAIRKLNLIQVGQNSDLNVNGNIFATTTQFQGNNKLILNDGTVITGALATTAANTGKLQFQGGGQVTDSIGAVNSLNLITVNAAGSANKNVELKGAVVKAGTININDDLSGNSANGSTLTFNNAAMVVTGNITATTDNENTLDVIKAATLNSSIGSDTQRLNLIKVAQNGDLNINGNIFATTTQFQGNNKLILNDGAVVTGAIATTAANTGKLQFQGGGQVTDSIGAVNSLNLITVNAAGTANKNLELKGAVVKAGTININDDLSGLSANGSTLTLNNAAMVLTGNITATTHNEDTLDVLNAATLNGAIGSGAQKLNLIKVAQNSDLSINGNIFATTTQFQGNNKLILNDGAVVTGVIDTTNANTGKLLFQGDGQVTDSIGAVNSLNLITVNAAGSTNKNVELKGAVVKADTININDDLSGNSANGSTLTLNNPAMVVTGNFTVTTNNENTLDVLNAVTLNGSIGSAAQKFNLIKVAQNGDLNINGNLSATTIQFQADNKLNLSDGAIVTGDVDTTAGNTGKLQFQGAGQVTGSIGAINSLNLITVNAAGSVNKNLELKGAVVKAGTININDDLSGNSNHGSTLSLNNAAMVVTGDITVTTDNENTLNVIKAAMINGDIGSAAQTFNLIKVGQNSDLTVNGNVFATTTQFQGNHTLSLSDGKTILGNIDSIASGSGKLAFQGGIQLDGNIGETHSLNLVSFNTNNHVNEFAELTGDIIKAFSINLSDDGSGNPLNGSILKLNNPNMVVTGNLTATTHKEDTLDIFDAKIINGNVGSALSSFNLVKVAQNNDLTVNGNIFADNIQFQGNNKVTFGNDGSAFGALTTVSPNTGKLAFDGNFTINFPIGTSPNNFNTITIHGPFGTTGHINNDIFATDVIVDNGSKLLIEGDYAIDGTLTITHGTLSLANDADLTITNMTGAGVLDLGSGTVLNVDMGANVVTIGSVTSAGVSKINANASLSVTNPPVSIPGSKVIVPIVISNGGPAFLNTIPVNNGSLFLNFSTDINGNNLDLIITSKDTSISTFGNQSNTQGVSYALDAIIDSGLEVSGPLGEILNQIGSITNQAALNQALATLAPVVDGAQIQESFNGQIAAFDAVGEYLDQVILKSKRFRSTRGTLRGLAAGDEENQDNSIWLKAFRQYDDQSKRDSIDGYHNQTEGFVGGTDWFYSDVGLVGIALGRSELNMTHHIAESKTNADSYQAALYGSIYFTYPFYFNWYAGLGYNDYTNHHDISVGSVNITARGDFSAWQYGIKGELGYICDFNAVQTIPVAKLYYSHLAFDEYTETGAGTLNQHVSGNDYDLLRIGTGVKFIYHYMNDGYAVIPELHFIAYHDLVNERMSTQSQFIISGPAFTTMGFFPTRFSANVGASLLTQIAWHTFFDIHYDFNFKENYTAHWVNMRLRFSW